MINSEQTSSPVKAVETSYRIIEKVKELDGVRMTELADLLELPNSTVSDHLVTLRANDYLVKSGNEYRIGLRFLELGDYARNYRNIYSHGKEKIDDLAETTDELVHLSVEENGRGVIIYETEGSNAISLDTYVGRRVPLHCTALGKAMLAHLGEERVEAIIEQYDLPAMTEQSITSRESLFDQLPTIREQGYAVSDGERIAELSCIAAPIKDSSSSTVFGAVSVCVPMSRLEDDRLKTELPNVVRQAANRIELDILYD